MLLEAAQHVLQLLLRVYPGDWVTRSPHALDGEAGPQPLPHRGHHLPRDGPRVVQLHPLPRHSQAPPLSADGQALCAFRHRAAAMNCEIFLR